MNQWQISVCQALWDASNEQDRRPQVANGCMWIFKRYLSHPKTIHHHKFILYISLIMGIVHDMSFVSPPWKKPIKVYKLKYDICFNTLSRNFPKRILWAQLLGKYFGSQGSWIFMAEIILQYNWVIMYKPLINPHIKQPTGVNERSLRKHRYTDARTWKRWWRLAPSTSAECWEPFWRYDPPNWAIRIHTNHKTWIIRCVGKE